MFRVYPLEGQLVDIGKENPGGCAAGAVRTCLRPGAPAGTHDCRSEPVPDDLPQPRRRGGSVPYPGPQFLGWRLSQLNLTNRLDAVIHAGAAGPENVLTSGLDQKEHEKRV